MASQRHQPNKYFLVDPTGGSKLTMRKKLVEVCAELCVDIGGHDVFMKKEENFRLFHNAWIKKFNEPLPVISLKDIGYKVDHVKWYIRENLSKDYGNGWNQDFIFGLTEGGRLYGGFPSFRWYGNDKLVEILQNCPFGGTLGRGCFLDSYDHRRIWSRVPALCMKYDRDSMSFLAGVMASGHPFEYKGEIYAKYQIGKKQVIDELGIPNIYSPKGRKLLISPIWPALMTLYMPDVCAKNWIGLENINGQKLYPPILWSIAIGMNFKSEGIPYLRCRRAVFYDFKCEEGAQKRLKNLYIDQLPRLDNRFFRSVKEWSEKE